MEEEIYYTTVVFKVKAPKEKKGDSTIYYAEVKPEEAASTVLNGEAAGCSRSRVLACVGVGILCVVLVAGIGSIIYLDMELNKQRANPDDITAENEKLIVEKSLLEGETRNLSRVAENLNRTLEIILTFDTFPVNEYCPEKISSGAPYGICKISQTGGKQTVRADLRSAVQLPSMRTGSQPLTNSDQTVKLECQPCLKSWILFKEKCYLFYEEKEPWMTWKDSRKFCLTKKADLVVIDNLQEQEFISNHTKPYYDRFHGYWIGLEETADKYWVWVDGRKDTLGYWMDNIGEPGPYALFIPGRNLTASWDPADNVFLNKFICENDPIIWST